MKKGFTLEQHKEAGNQFKEIDRLLNELTISMSISYSLKLSDKLSILQDKINCVRSEMESKMFEENGSIDDKAGFGIYYTSTNRP